MVKEGSKVNIRDIFLGLQKQMMSKLSVNKKILTHPVAKGDSAEAEWIKMLSAYLPSRYCVDRAFIIDCDGNVSEQIDIVIYDRHYSPFILRQEGSTYIPAESIYAVIEVKPSLSKKNIQYASNKAQSVRKLKRTTATIVHAGGKIKKPKRPFFILAGILASDGNLPTNLKTSLKDSKNNDFLHFGCSLQRGSFWFKRSGRQKLSLEISSKDDALIFFFLNLLAELQQLGTVPAINLKAYIKSFKENRAGELC